MKMRACAGVVIALALSAGAAHAESPNPAAKQHYDAAMAAYGLGHYAEAADEFEKTYQLRPLARGGLGRIWLRTRGGTPDTTGATLSPTPMTDATL